MGVQIAVSKVKTTVNISEDLLKKFQKALVKYYGKVKGAQESAFEDSVKLWLGMFAGLRVYAGKIMNGSGKHWPIVLTGEELPKLFENGDIVACTLKPVSGTVADTDINSILGSLGDPEEVWVRKGDIFKKVSEFRSVEELFSEGFEDAAFLWGLQGPVKMPFANAKQILYVSSGSLEFSRG